MISITELISHRIQQKNQTCTHYYTVSVSSIFFCYSPAHLKAILKNDRETRETLSREDRNNLFRLAKGMIIPQENTNKQQC